MFDTPSIESIVIQSLEVAIWMMARLSEVRASAQQMIWDSSPWWFRGLIVAAAINGSYLAIRRWIRAFTR